MLADIALTPIARALRRALFLLAVLAVLLAFGDGRAGAVTPPGRGTLVRAVSLDGLPPSPVSVAAGVLAGVPRAAATPSPSGSTKTTTSTKKKSSSSLILVVLVGVGVIFYVTSRRRKTANGGVPPARGIGGGRFGGGAGRRPAPPQGDAPSRSPPVTPPARSHEGRPRPKRRGR